MFSQLEKCPTSGVRELAFSAGTAAVFAMVAGVSFYIFLAWNGKMSTRSDKRTVRMKPFQSLVFRLRIYCVRFVSSSSTG
ncbi:hypothetical protein ElyMa_003612400 [Elysia marginata]|uniref:Uncharacterized protein n=1 Tax=Elysia marginata TaxID=1093978 RepID=A0AAV4ERU3_9GAST|nr:hypothetical protein ElyMa_003612400 [Elysia marginata]